MIISSWNINSIRIRTKNIEEYINKIDPDILMFQEIKCEDDKFPYDFFDHGTSKLIESQLFGISRSFYDFLRSFVCGSNMNSGTNSPGAAAASCNMNDIWVVCKF